MMSDAGVILGYAPPQPRGLLLCVPAASFCVICQHLYTHRSRASHTAFSTIDIDTFSASTGSYYTELRRPIPSASSSLPRIPESKQSSTQHSTHNTTTRPHDANAAATAAMSFGKTGYRDGGNRGGHDRFRWDQVKEDKHRENYLGHSLKVRSPVCLYFSLSLSLSLCVCKAWMMGMGLLAAFKHRRPIVPDSGATTISPAHAHVHPFFFFNTYTHTHTIAGAGGAVAEGQRSAVVHQGGEACHDGGGASGGACVRACLRSWVVRVVLGGMCRWGLVGSVSLLLVVVAVVSNALM
jgi:hypothetical protein